MSRARAIAEQLLPWTGLIFGIAAVAFVHQFGSDSVFDDCRSASPGPVLVAAVVGLLLCVISGFASWRCLGSGSEARRVVAAISVGCAALFAFAILFPMIAALILPPCFG